jgi:hypothetical protein
MAAQIAPAHRPGQDHHESVDERVAAVENLEQPPGLLFWSPVLQPQEDDSATLPPSLEDEAREVLVAGDQDSFLAPGLAQDVCIACTWPILGHGADIVAACAEGKHDTPLDALVGEEPSSSPRPVAAQARRSEATMVRA